MIANFQLLWAERGDYIDKATIPYLGPERSRYLYPARSLRDAGAVIAGGSDWGVSSFDPFIAMEHGITRSERRGLPALLPEQSLTLQDMVDAYTINAASCTEAGTHHRQHREWASAAISSCSIVTSFRDRSI